MKQSLNPSYSAKMNDSPTSFTLMVHVPELPAASSAYKDKAYFLKTDARIYHCIESRGKWTWEPVTFGISRQFVLPVTWIVGGSDGHTFTFNDEVATVRTLIVELARYDKFFSDLLDELKGPVATASNAWIRGTSNTGATLNTIIEVSNIIIDWVNHNCGVDLSLIPTGLGSGVINGATCEELAAYLNELIGVLNPHAGFSVEISRIDASLAALSALVDSPYAFVETSDTTPVSGKIYYTKTGSTYTPVESISSFVTGTKYYEVSGGTTVATPQEFNALRIKVGGIDEVLAAYKSSQAVVNNTLAEKTNNHTAAISSLTELTGAIIEEYIGWQNYTATDKKTIIARLATLESQLGTGGSGTIASRIAALEGAINNETTGINAKLSTVTTGLTNLSASLTTLSGTVGDSTGGLVKKVAEIEADLDDEKSARESQDAVHTQLLNKLNGLKNCIQTIAGVSISEDAGFSEVCAAIRTIKTAATAALECFEEESEEEEE